MRSVGLTLLLLLLLRTAYAGQCRRMVGVRRSQRLQGNDMMRNYHLQLQMQNQIYNTCIQR